MWDTVSAFPLVSTKTDQAQGREVNACGVRGLVGRAHTAILPDFGALGDLGRGLRIRAARAHAATRSEGNRSRQPAPVALA
jgi:hypothetical protein